MDIVAIAIAIAIFQPSEGCIREAAELGDDGRHKPAALNRTSGFRPKDPRSKSEIYM